MTFDLTRRSFFCGNVEGSPCFFLLPLWFATPQSSAAVIQYTGIFEVKETGQLPSPTIAASSIAIGDKFAVSFSVDTDSLQTSSSGGVAIFGNILQDLQFSRLSGNAGDFVPLISGTHTVGVREENGQKRLSLSSTFIDGSTVSYDSGSATGATATFFRYSFRFNMSGSYTDLGTGTLLSAYLTEPPSEWIIDESSTFIFRDVPGNSGNFGASGIQPTIPEASTSMTWIFGIGCCLIGHRRCKG